MTQSPLMKGHTGGNITLATVKWEKLHSAKRFAKSIRRDMFYTVNIHGLYNIFTGEAGL